MLAIQVTERINQFVYCYLPDCLSSFTDVEELEESELYMCSNCKQKQKSTKKFWIRRLPNVNNLISMPHSTKTAPPKTFLVIIADCHAKHKCK